MTDVSNLPQDGRIRRYLDLAAEARKHARAPYAGLFVVIPPDQPTITIREFAVLYAVVGGLLFIAALTSIYNALMGNRA